MLERAAASHNAGLPVTCFGWGCRFFFVGEGRGLWEGGSMRAGEGSSFPPHLLFVYFLRTVIIFAVLQAMVSGYLWRRCAGNQIHVYQVRFYDCVCVVLRCESCSTTIVRRDSPR